ncbi:hypothetical protein BC829DRAFT_394355 [Chytridium lagenaria]|nr:hypothetical protein BC829DRAFT_394355 [Chytridium lagenaria]
MLSASTSSQSLNFDIHDEDEDEDDPLSSIVGPLPKRTPTVATGTGLMGLPHLDDVLTGLPAGTWQDGMWKSESGGLVGEGDGEAGTKELLSTVDDGDGKVGMEGFGSGWASTLSMDADFDMLLGNTTGNAY